MRTRCDHRITEVTLTPESIHYGKELCSDCGAFIRFVKKPETVVRENELTAKIIYLQGQELSEWERGFIRSIGETGPKLSPKQHAIVERMCATYKFPVST